MKKKTLFYALAMASTMAMASPALAECGTVKFFNGTKGFGFIKADDTGREIFVHVSGTKNDIRTGDRVCYDLQEGKKGLQAVNVYTVAD